MNRRKRDRIIANYRFGYRIWRIARDERVSTDDVAEVLVGAGLVRETMVELVVKRQTRKPGKTRDPLMHQTQDLVAGS